MRGITNILLVAALLLPTAAPPRAQGVPAPGFRLVAGLQLPGSAFLSGFDHLPGGDLLYLSGTALRRRTGSTTVTVHNLPQGTYGAFVQTTAQGVFFAESTRGTVYRFDPATNTTTSVTAVASPFDLAQAPGGALYLATGYGTATTAYRTRIHRLDPKTGGLTVVADLAGPTGPIAFDPAGNLHYALQSPLYPTPPGAIRILRWSAAALAAATPTAPLTETGARTVKGGLDGAYDMEIDVFGRILITDPVKGGVVRWDPATHRLESLVAPGPTPGTGHTILRLVAGSGAATLDPWQPDRGAALFVLASDYATFTRIERLAARRPALTGAPWPEVKPGGSLSLDLADAPARNPVLLLVSPAAFAPEGVVGWWGPAPLHVGAWLHPQAGIVPLTTDGSGRLRLRLPYAGGGPLTVYLQAYLPGGPYGFLGSSTPWAVRLR